MIIGGGAGRQGEIRKIYPSAQGVEVPADGDIENIQARIERAGPVEHVFWIASDAPVEFLEDERIIQEQEIGVIQVFRLVKAFLGLGYGARDLGWTLVTFGAQPVRRNDSVNPIYAGVHGFAGSLAKEYPRWRVRMLDLEPGLESFPESMWALPSNPRGEALVCRGSEWFEQTLIPVREVSGGKSRYRSNGVYVLIGGAGGIGEVVSRELIELYQARVVWIGRRVKDASIQDKLDALSALGTAPHYITADARNRSELQRAYEEIKGKFGAIHGVFHSALGSYDQSLAEMEMEQFRAVLSAKIDVCVRLAQVFQDEPLDFVVFFSSLAAFGKSRGMSSYAAACTFKDAFARQLGKLWPAQSKVMNWGYWNIGGGARISESLRRHIEQTEHILPIEPTEGLEALRSLLSGPFDQLAFIKTKASAKLRGVRVDECATVYSETIPSAFDTLRGFSPRAEAPQPHPGVEALESWMVKLLFRQLAAMGVFRESLAEDVTALRRRAGVVDKYALWWNEAMKELQRDGLVHLEGNKVRVGEKFAAGMEEGVWLDWDAFKERCGQDAQMSGPVAVVEECFQKLPAILRGEILTTDILFPQGSMEKMEALYKDNAVSRYFNDVLAESVAAYVEQRLSTVPGAKIRILEIGAGTGGTTSVLLPQLRRFATAMAEYCYTDLSHAFLIKAEERYSADYPFVTCKICDVERPLAEQGIAPGAYDIVVATNVLHATKRIRQALRHTKAALAKNGLLVLNEMSSKTVFATLLFGLIDGWSRAEDTALRIPGSPGLLPKTWQWLLEDEGFGSVLFPADNARHLGQQIVLGESDGIVRQKIGGAHEMVAETKAPLVPPAAIPEMAAASEADLAGCLRKQILCCLSQSLRVPEAKIDVDLPFSDYGVDSILGSQFINQLGDALGLSLNTTIIFDHPTADRLSKHLAETHRNVLKPLLPKFNSGGGQASEVPASATKKGSPSLAPDGPEPVAAIHRGEKAERSADIAVIGMSGQFPGAEDPCAFWSNLVAGVDAVGELPSHYLDMEKDYSPAKVRGKSYCRDGGVLKYRDCFDPLFFHLSPRDAESMNLHQRLVLQESWKALEDAGHNPRALSGSRTGAFVGAEPTGYFHETFTGASDAIIASRLSYFLDLRGPALLVNTGCSSSGVALHLACESLRNGESALALAGGVFAAIGKTALVPLSEIEMLSPSGRCRTFDASGDGMVLSEGVGMVVLKRLEDAERDGDSIYGVIKASGMNQDGASNGITAPNGAAQEALITEVYRRHGIDPETISYVEAHGTGTRLGDPIEANALSRAFKRFTDQRSYCALGSAKAHIGHTAASAAVIGLMTVWLSMRHRKRPGLLHFKRLNPQIELEGSPFFIPVETTEWRAKGTQPLTAALNSFGHSGTNVHLVIQEHAPSRAAGSVASESPSGAVIPLSAKDGDRLKEVAGRLLGYLKVEPKADLARMAYTLQTGREAMSHRVAFVVNGILELEAELKGFLEQGEPAEPSAKGNGRLLAADEDAEALVATWIAKRKLNKLAEIWSAGVDLDWSKLYGATKPIRLHLPAYPFARERYWIEPVDPRTRVVASIASPENRNVPAQPGETIDSSIGLLLAFPEWQGVPIAKAPPFLSFDERIAITCGLLSPVALGLETRWRGAACLHLRTEAESPERHYESLSLQLFEQLKRRLQEKPKTRTLVQLLVSSDENGAMAEGLAALLKTATQENPKLIGQWIEIGAGEAEDAIMAKLEENAREPFASQVRYQDGVRQARGWHKISLDGIKTDMPWKDQGVYLITGGVGGLGMVFAGEIAAQVAAPILVLCGRSALDPTKQAQIKALERSGTVVEYRQIDVAQEGEVQELVRDIVNRHGKLDGVLHSAGVNRDNYILKKNAEEFRSVLRPKVHGAVNLDRATADLSLDFFVLFSSGAAATGNVGQADYAAANGFLDQFATYRTGLAAAGRRQGRTLSINWPLWRDGGMRVDAATAATMKQKTGMEAMPTAAGLEAFYRAMGTGQPQVAVMWGDLARSEKAGQTSSQSMAPQPKLEAEPRSLATNDLREGTLRQLKQMLGRQIKLSPERIASQEPFERYGIDSIAIAELNRRLETIFGEISKTLFFEYHTLRELGDYLAGEYPHECAKWAGRDEAEPSSAIGKSPAIAGSNGHAPPSVPAGTEHRTGQEAAGEKRQEPIAIIGLCGRYPQAETLDDFWRNLEGGKDCITEIPPERWTMDGFFHEHPEEAVALRKSFGKWGGFLEGFADFDPLFFNISPREALGMDPQERLFLQACWEVLEDAGYTRGALEKVFGGNVGVFAGITKTGYNLHVSEMKRQGKLVYPHTSFSSVANRVSYFLNLRGPSMPIDTMCSSSLTAVHEACERLRRGDCALALAGGVNLYLHPDNYVELSALKMLSKDGKCRSFGKGGNGFVPGEGVGVVLLKPLAKAIADQDRIYAVLRGTHVNHGGKTNGYTMPNPNAQSALIRETLDKAGVHARAVSYVEAHGTGTELGDPIEVGGLTQAFAKDTPDKGFCALGSAKSNLGHLEAAAGIAGLTKIILQMKHGQLAPSLHAAELNPNIDFAKTPFTVQQKLTEWSRPIVAIEGEKREYPRIAGLSSFGAGGANAHVIVEEYGNEPPSSRPRPRLPYLVVLSARTKERLRAQAQSMLAFANRELAETQLQDFAYTLQVGREAMDERLAFMVLSKAELIEQLSAFVEGREPPKPLFFGQVDHEKESLVGANGTEAAPFTGYPKDQEEGGRLLELWVRGLEVDWEQLHGGVRPRRIGLPTYPFVRERYWISAAPSVLKNVMEKSAEPAVERPRVIAALAAPRENLAMAPSQIEKPRGVQLRPLSSQLAPEKPMEPSPLPVASPLKPAAQAPARAEVAPKPVAAIPVKEAISERKLVQSLTESLSHALYIDAGDIDVDKPFIDIGLDSIVGVEWIHAINKAFGLDLLASKVYDHPTVRKFAAHLAKTLAGRAPVQPMRAEKNSAPAPSQEPLEAPQPVVRSHPVIPREPIRQVDSGRIAIVGISGRYPDAEDLSQYWRNLTQARNSVREVPPDRWDVNAYFDPDPSAPGKVYCKWLGALKDIDCFDPLFFMISPGEAESMDPQHRLFLEESYKAFEDAGYGPQSLGNKKCGVYMGIMSYEYAFLLQKHGAAFTNTGNSFAIGAARAPYFLNLKGPAIPVDTACSSSLVATHLACQALKNREVDLALAGGVSLYLTPEAYIGMCAAGMISRDGQCKPFDDGADGFVPGEGVGTLVLKRLEDAERDGDVIHGVIIGSGINQDGRTNGITAPSVNSQIELERDIYRRYGIDPATITYVETHGTGTKLGDPIELEALATVFSEWTERRNFCALGSVKSNIGHTSAAAGVAGVHKVLLAMRHGQLPPTLNFKTPNRHFNFEQSPFYVNVQLMPWAAERAQPRRAAVSSFGFSGTNAHLVIEEYVAPRATRPDERANEPFPIVLSAKRADGLAQAARRLHDFLVAEPAGANLDLRDLAYTLQVGRDPMEERLAFTASSITEVAEKLQQFLNGGGNGLFRGGVKEKDETLETLLADGAIDATIDLWMQKRAFAQILKFWVKGLAVDWNKLGGSSQPRRISLPTYPFFRQRCWFESGATEAVTLTAIHDKEDSRDSNIIRDLSFSLKQLDPMRAAREFIPRDFEQILGELLWGILHSMGLFEYPAFTSQAAMRAGGVIDKYERWMKETMSIFERSQALEFDGERYIVRHAGPVDLESLWDRWDERKKLEGQHFAKRKQQPLIEACLRSLPKILTGGIPAVEVLFPGSSLALVEGIYRDNPVSDLFNDVLARSFVACLEKRLARQPSARIRILEIGAGTGGMTEAILPKLELYGTHILEYCYTDVSKAFLFEAGEKYLAKYPFIRTEVFDVEKPVSGQKIGPEPYDFVIASNVLHATRNIRRTVQNAKAALRPGGLLLLNEISNKSILGHLTFGLLDGWWSNEDNALRIPGSPALSPKTWEKVLHEAGFKHVVFPCAEAHLLGQQVILAESDGDLSTAEPAARQKAQPGVVPAPAMGKEWLSFTESWVGAPLATEQQGWLKRIEAKKGHRILVISESADDADDIRQVCGRVAALAQEKESLWDVRHLRIDLEAKSGIEAVDLRRFLPDAVGPQAIFVFLPSISKGTSAWLELAYSCVQAVMRAVPVAPVCLYGCYREEEPDLWLHGEALASLFKSAMLESLHHRFRTIACDGRLVTERQVALRLIQEWLCDATTTLPPSVVPMVRYAGGERFELRVQEVREIEKAEAGAGFRTGGTYLMVGALGPAGALICEELGRRYRARLAIFSRRSEDEVQPALTRIREAGASVIYRSVDILDRAGLDRAMQSLKADGVEIQGVVHMARQVSDAPIVAKSFQGFSETLAAKVEGTSNIDAVTAAEPLEFFLMYSSLAAFGIQGSPDYAFSTGFQNAMARHRDRLVQRGLRSGVSRSICWGQWTVDGAVNPDKLPARLERLRRIGMDFIDVPSAMQIMETCLNGRSEVAGFLAVSDEQKARRAIGLDAAQSDDAARISAAIAAFESGEWSRGQFADFLECLPNQAIGESVQKEIVRVISASDRPSQAAPSGTNGHGQVLLRASAGPAAKRPQRNFVEQALGTGVKQVLKVAEADLDWNEPLPNYGLDSIIAMQLATVLEKALKFPVQPAWLIEFPTLNQLRKKLNRENPIKEDSDALR